MDNKPRQLSAEEIREIAAIEDIQQMWGAANTEEMVEMLDNTVYAVKFAYMSGGPGYCGDYFILQGDALGEPLELVRDRNHILKIV